MTKAVIFGLLLPAILSVSGCSEVVYSAGQPQTLNASLRENSWSNEWNSIKEDYEGVKQETRMYSADGELLLTITENKEVFIFTKSLELDKWDYSVSQIPQDAVKLCTYVGYREQSGQMVTQAVNTVYYDDNGYYHLTEAPGAAGQVKMSDQAALYLIELAGLELSGSEKFSDHKMTQFSGDSGVTSQP